MSQEPKVTRFGALPTVDAELATKAYVDSGGGGQTFAKVVKSADEIVNNSSVIQDDDELLFTPTINTTYGFLIVILYASNATPDIKFGWSVPAGATMEWINSGQQSQPTTDETATPNVGGTGATAHRMMIYRGRMIMAGTAGDINFQWAQNVANASDTTVFEGSYFLVWEE